MPDDHPEVSPELAFPVEMKGTTSMRYELDHNCMVVNPSIHDGLLISIATEQSETCRLRFRSSSSELVEFVLGGLLHFRATDFMLGNIVGELFLYQGIQIPEARLRELIFWNGHENASYLYSLKQQCHEAKLLLFELEPAYGCRIQALCGTASVEIV